jgi:hypothetical protein
VVDTNTSSKDGRPSFAPGAMGDTGAPNFHLKVLSVTCLLLVTAILVGVGWLPVPDGIQNDVGNPLSAAEALGLVNTSELELQGHPWVPVEAVGFGAPESVTLPTSLLTGFFPKCTTVFTSSEPLTLPANPPEAFPGNFPNWEIVSIDPIGGLALAFVSNVGLKSATIALIENSGCTTVYPNVSVLPSRFIDSPQIGELANENGGSGFTSQHQRVTEEMQFTNATWAVVYTTCSPYDSSGVGDQFLAGFESGTGKIIGIQANETGVPCSSATFEPRLS